MAAYLREEFERTWDFLTIDVAGYPLWVVLVIAVLVVYGAMALDRPHDRWSFWGDLDSDGGDCGDGD